MYFARACVRAHACTRTDKQEEACTHKGIAAAHRKKQVDEPFPTRRNNRNTVKLIRNQGHFFSRNGKKSLKKSVPPPPRKNPGFSGSVPLERSVLCHPKNKNFPGIAVFCQPENENFPRTANFMPAGRRKK